jgi:hypothetical protein
MGIWGWLLLTTGGLGAVLFGGIGFDGVANLPGTLLGCALLVSGSVFIGASAVQRAQLITINIKHNGIDQSYDLKPLGDGSLAGQGGIGGREIIRFLSLDEATNYYTEILRSKGDAMNSGSTEGAKREEK